MAVPVKVGFSLSNYYELRWRRQQVRLLQYCRHRRRCRSGRTTNFGAWNIHGGVEFQALGDTTKFFNGGDGSQVIGSIGIGFSY